MSLAAEEGVGQHRGVMRGPAVGSCWPRTTECAAHSRAAALAPSRPKRGDHHARSGGSQHKQAHPCRAPAACPPSFESVHRRLKTLAPRGCSAGQGMVGRSGAGRGRQAPRRRQHRDTLETAPAAAAAAGVFPHRRRSSSRRARLSAALPSMMCCAAAAARPRLRPLLHAKEGAQMARWWLAGGRPLAMVVGGRRQPKSVCPTADSSQPCAWSTASLESGRQACGRGHKSAALLALAAAWRGRGCVPGAALGRCGCAAAVRSEGCAPAAAEGGGSAAVSSDTAHCTHPAATIAAGLHAAQLTSPAPTAAAPRLLLRLGLEGFGVVGAGNLV